MDFRNQDRLIGTFHYGEVSKKSHFTVKCPLFCRELLLKRREDGQNYFSENQLVGIIGTRVFYKYFFRSPKYHAFEVTCTLLVWKRRFTHFVGLYFSWFYIRKSRRKCIEKLKKKIGDRSVCFWQVKFISRTSFKLITPLIKREAMITIFSNGFDYKITE